MRLIMLTTAAEDNGNKLFIKHRKVRENVQGEPTVSTNNRNCQEIALVRAETDI